MAYGTRRFNAAFTRVPHCGAFSIPHSHPSCAQIFASVSCFQISLGLDSSLNVRDQVSQTYSTAGNIIVLYILIFKFLERSLDDKSVWTE